MSGHSGSLKVRLAIFAALGISALLGLTGFLFNFLFERHVEKFALAELTNHFDQLASTIDVLPTGELSSTTELSDPRFSQPYSGLYWQVDKAGFSSLRSRSLWDEALNVPTPPNGTEDDHAHILPGPDGQQLLSLERLIIAQDEAAKDHTLILTVAMDRGRITNAVTSFQRSMVIGLFALYLALLATSMLLIIFGLRPMRLLKSSVSELRNGTATTIVGNYPEEVAPLVDEVNALVAAREKQLDRARQRAGNLAHGLKTPLTILAAVADDVEASKQNEAAQIIRTVSGQMRDLVDRELARSRMALADSSHRADLSAIVERIVATVSRAPKGENINWDISVPSNTIVNMDQTDLLELVGNLIDNARKHTRTRVHVSHDGKVLSIADDGPGVPPEKMKSIARRGVKLDALAAGSGLGLAIVTDLAEVYQFDLTFTTSQWGGLQVNVELPSLK